MTTQKRIAVRLIILTFIVAIILSQLSGYMIEFSPDLLVFRTSRFLGNEAFCYFREDSADSPLLELIKRHKPVESKLSSPAIRWSFVYGEKLNVIGWRGAARKWHKRGYDQSVIEWSNNNPRIAEVLWPHIVRLLQQEEYSVVELLLRKLETIQLDNIEVLIDELRKDKGLDHPKTGRRGSAKVPKCFFKESGETPMILLHALAKSDADLAPGSFKAWHFPREPENKEMETGPPLAPVFVLLTTWSGRGKSPMPTAATRSASCL